MNCATNPLTVRQICSVFPIMAVLLTHSGMGIATLAVVLITIAWQRLTKLSDTQKKLWAPFYFGIYVLFLVGCYVIFYNEWIDTSGRANSWKHAWIYWDANADPWIGFGPGQTVTFMPFIQKIFNLNYKGNMLWLHNDWLQVLFEQGVIGLVSVILCFYCLFIRVITSTLYFPIITGCGFFAVGNFPAHWAIQCATVTFIGIAAFRLTRNKNSTHRL